MMPVDFETLNAYVDGELSPAEAAGVARAAAHDPAVADQIASLRETKAALAELVPATTLRLPDEQKREIGAFSVAAVAASLVAVLIIGVVLSGFLQHESQPELSSVLAAHHSSWAFTPSTERSGLEEARRAGDAMQVLDLSAARLAFAGRERFTYGNMVLERLGYEGTRGCRLSLFRAPRDLEISADAFAAPLHVRVWQDGEHNFLLMAHGMAQQRFTELAAVIEEALRDHRPFDAETRQRLAQARAASRPCQA